MWKLLVLIFSLPLAAQQTSGIWLDVPFVAQPPEGCGDAALAMVMQYWDAQLKRPKEASSIRAIIKAIPPGKHGVAGSDLLAYMHQHGYRGFVLKGNWSDIEEQIAKGRPLIAAIHPPAAGSALHYVVIAGVESNAVLYNDPANRRFIKEDRMSFEEEWRAGKDWLLLAVPELY